MKKLVFIISFLLAIQYSNFVYATDTNEILEEQEQTLGISTFLKEAENYTNEAFSDIDLSSMYKSAISGEISTDGILKRYIKYNRRRSFRYYKNIRIHINNHCNS